MELGKATDVKLVRLKHGSWVKAWEADWLLALGFPKEEVGGQVRDEQGKIKPITLAMTLLKDEAGNPFLKLAKPQTSASSPTVPAS